MKKQFYSKLLFLFALLLTVSTSAWAETESTILTLDFSSVAAASNSTTLTTETAATLLNSAAGLESGITCSAINTVYDGKGQGGDGIPQKCLKVGKAKGPGSITFTIPSSYDEVSKVEITGYGWKNTSSISINGGTAQTYSTAATEATKTFELSTASREIAIAVTTSAVCITEIKLIKVASSGTPTCATPTFSPGTGTYAETQNVTISTTTSGATIYYTTDGTEPTTSSSVYSAPVSVSTSKTLKAIATASGYDNSSVATAAYTIVTIEHDGTEAEPYTVADARNAIDANTGITGVYAKGIVSRIYSASVNADGQISYYISEDGQTTSPELEAYNGLNIGGAAFTAIDDIQVGDEVVIYGNLKKYNDTYEFDKNNQLVSLKHPVSEEPSIDVARTSVTVNYTGEENGEIEVTYNNIDKDLAEVQWFESDGSTPATYGWIAAEIDKANNNISYIIGENDTEAARTAYLKVYALDNNANDVYSELITITQARAPFTVTYYVAGEKFTTTRLEGAALNLTAPDALGGYQFAGWSTANNATTPDFVENTAAVNSNLTLYAIFVKESGVSTYNLVEEQLSDWSGDYIIAYSNEIFADGRVSGTEGIGKEGTQASTDGLVLSSDGKTINGDWGDTYHVTLVKCSSDQYLLQTQDGRYNYQTNNKNGITSTANAATAANYYLTVTFNSSSDVQLCLNGGAQGAVFRYNDNGYFRYYKDGGQNPIYLYRKTIITNPTYTLNEPEATITAAANATWVAPAKVKITSTDVKVYTVTYDDAVGCTRKHEVADKVVPANGVVLLTSDDATTVTLENTADEATDFAALENDLLGSDGTVQGAANIFCLAVGEKGLGFYPVDSSIKVPAGKAYLLIPTTQAAPSYIWFNGDTTAIDSLTTDTAAGNESGEIYSLTGQRVGKNYRGIVIMNGRKVLKK